MKLISYLKRIDDLDCLQEEGVEELILGCAPLSRFLNNTVSDLIIQNRECLRRGIRSVLEWDILMEESRFGLAIDSLKEISLETFDAVRVRDLGAFNYLIDHYCSSSPLKIQMILENGNHNITSIVELIKLAGGSLERIILAPNLSLGSIENFKAHIDLPIEILGVGRILLSSTPRKLLSYQYDNLDRGPDKGLDEGLGLWKEADATCCEGKSYSLKVLENQHGTFVFYHGHYFPWPDLARICQINPDYFRLDLRFHRSLQTITEIKKLLSNFDQEGLARIEEEFGGQFLTNWPNVDGTEKMIHKLKNPHLCSDNRVYLGDVLDFKQKKYIALMLRNPHRSIKVGDRLTFITPEGRKLESRVSFLYNSSLENIEEGEVESVVLINHISGVSVRTAVYLNIT